MNRGQTGLPALAIALLVLTVVTGLGLVVADGALRSAERDASERRIATSSAERLVAGDSPLTERSNVLNATRIDRLDGTALEETFPVVAGHDVRVRVNGSAVATTGDVSTGTSFRRLVVLQREQERTLQPDLDRGHTVTLPRRTTAVTLEMTPPANASVTAVRANDRVVLRNESGLSGQFTVRLSRFETTELRFDVAQVLPAGSVTIRYPAPETTKTTLVVTVDE